MTRLALLLVACSLETEMHSPDIGGAISGDRCGRVPVATYTAGEGQCIRLTDDNGRTLFRLDTSESCGGPACLRLKPGETGYALEKVKLGERAEWDVQVGACDELPKCNNEVRP